MTNILFYYVITEFIIHVVAIGVVSDCIIHDDIYIGFAWLNPSWLYRNIKVNWFGAALIAFVANIALPVISLCYWLYKLCTVGRR